MGVKYLSADSGQAEEVKSTRDSLVEHNCMRHG